MACSAALKSDSYSMGSHPHSCNWMGHIRSSQYAAVALDTGNQCDGSCEVEKEVSSVAVVRLSCEQFAV